MQRTKILWAILLPITLGFFTACDDNSSSSGTPSTPAAGTWKVAYFFDKQDETSHYTSYTFEFEADGGLSATNGSQTWTGTWQSGYDDSADKFLIDFNGSSLPSALEDLEEDWRIVKMDDNLMHFEHTSGGNGDTDILKFEK